MLDTKVLNIPLPADLKALLEACPGWGVPGSREEILTLAMGELDKPEARSQKPEVSRKPEAKTYDVTYEVPGKGQVLEATVTRCKNGLSVNYPDPKMRRRDPDCLVVADDQPSDKDR